MFGKVKCPALPCLPRPTRMSSLPAACHICARCREVPAFTLPGEGPEVGRRVDPTPAINMTVLQRLQADFERKRGTGMPVPVAVHEPYLTAR